MIAAADTTRVAHFHALFWRFEGLVYIYSFEDFAIEILAEDLRSLINDNILRVDHDNIRDTKLEKCFAHFLRMARIDKNKGRQNFLLALKHIPNITRF